MNRRWSVPDALRLMGEGRAVNPYPPDLYTPIHTLRDAIQLQMARAMELLRQLGLT